ncbi:3-keto sterol reductase [Pluteus cervinus]|uniref:3-keto sterol reductase n=1 Tax=Pluteus cervinus TaxID=181527 RepID=A0ACD3B890_9AGAR|nr:3-keto sterol reductase [Pluteus cervinus]
MSNRWPIVVVTGANGGVGYGICQRLLVQLCSRQPADALPQRYATHYDDSADHTIPPCEGIILIMACRNEKRAELARQKLYHFLDAHVARLQVQPDYNGYAGSFRKNVKIEIHLINLSSMQAVFSCGDEIARKYPYVSHLICNAGLASFDKIHWPLFFKQLLADPIGLITAPTFNLQHAGELSLDGLGYVWQSNLFGHYALFRALEPIMSASRSPLGSRVIWMSSLEANPIFWDNEQDDWQLRRTSHSYELSKYQIDLIATYLDQLALRTGRPNAVRHLIAEPGVCSTNVAAAITGPLTDFIKVMLFYLGRLFGSQHHTIQPFKAAISAVHLALVPLALVTFWVTESPSKGRYMRPPVRFGAETGRWGDERVGVTEVKQWDVHQSDAPRLLEKIDTLLREQRSHEEEPQEFERASDRM